VIYLLGLGVECGYELWGENDGVFEFMHDKEKRESDMFFVTNWAWAVDGAIVGISRLVSGSGDQ